MNGVDVDRVNSKFLCLRPRPPLAELYIWPFHVVILDTERQRNVPNTRAGRASLAYWLLALLFSSLSSLLNVPIKVPIEYGQRGLMTLC